MSPEQFKAKMVAFEALAWIKARDPEDATRRLQFIVEERRSIETRKGYIGPNPYHGVAGRSSAPQTP